MRKGELRPWPDTQSTTELHLTLLSQLVGHCDGVQLFLTA
jgi:hypothetical protein